MRRFRGCGLSGRGSDRDVGENSMAIFEDMSTLEKQELIVSLAALICADAKVEINVRFASPRSPIEGEP